MTTWVPGDPIHRPAPYRGCLFNFRDAHDEDCEDDDCLWIGGRDAASWPVPRPDNSLPARDELEEFIARWRSEGEEAS